MTTAPTISPAEVSARPAGDAQTPRDDASGPRPKPDPLTLAAQAARYRECYTQAHLASQRATQCESELTDRNEEERSATHHLGQWSRMLIGSMVDLMPGLPGLSRWYQRDIALATFEADGVTFALVADPVAEPPGTRRELIERTRILMLGERPPVADEQAEQPPAPDAETLPANLPEASPEPPAPPVDKHLRECCGAALRFFAAVRPRWEKGRDWVNGDECQDVPPPPGRRSHYDTWDFIERLYSFAEKAAAFACLATDPSLLNPRDWSDKFSVEDLPTRTVRFEGRHFVGGGLIEGTDRSKRLACVMTDPDRGAPGFVEPEAIQGAIQGAELEAEPSEAAPESALRRGVVVRAIERWDLAREQVAAIDPAERPEGDEGIAWDRARDAVRLDARRCESWLGEMVESHADEVGVEVDSDDDAERVRPMGVRYRGVTYALVASPVDAIDQDEPPIMVRIEPDRVVDLG